MTRKAKDNPIAFKNFKSPRNLCQQVTDELGRKILTGEISPGDILPQEKALCEQLGVSRTVVREAIKSLSARGLVESRSKRGTLVTPSKQWNYLDPEVLLWQSEGALRYQQLVSLTELRQAIEPAAAELAASRASEEELLQVRAAYDAMAAAVDTVDEFVAADLQFHTEILSASGNQFFAPVANVIRVSLESSLRITNRQASDNRTSLKIHATVMQPICDRQPAKARKAMETLLAEAAERIVAAASTD